MTSAPQEAELHRAIGLVYDSALDAKIWPAALEAMSGLIGACYGSISIMDTKLRAMRLAIEWCPDPEWPKWRKLLDERYMAMSPFHEAMHRFDIGAVYNTAQMAEASGIAADTIYEHPFFKEFVLPAGRRDTVGCVLMRNQSRFGLFALQTAVDHDLVGPQELAIGSVLAPHVRRAVHIGDVLGMVEAKAATLQGTLDTFSAAVVVTDDAAQVIYCNSAGDAMLKAGSPLFTQDGHLRAAALPATRALLTAIGQTVDPFDRIGTNGIGVPLRADDGSPALAHVLPLARDAPRRDGGARATAAVFVTPVETALPEADALIALYGLTPMEARVALQIAAGRRRADASVALGIADNTAKTHLDRVYSKTGAGDRSALTRIVSSLASPGRVMK